MKRTLLFLSVFVCGISATKAQNCTELFISEYVEGSGNDKAIELYNPTGNAIDLAGYRIERFSNGQSTSSSGGVLNLSGTIAAYSTFVITNGQTTGTTSSPACSPELQAMADLLDGVYPAPTYMNGNDAIVLYKNSSIVDILGKTGDGSMTTAYGWGDEFPYDGSVGAVWTENHTLIRKSSVLKGVTANPDPFIVNTEWDSLPKDTWVNLGSHICDCYVGLNESNFSNLSFAIFPNPSVNGEIQISSTEFITEIEVIDVLGQISFQTIVLEKSKNVVIEENKISKGVYTVKIKFANNAISQAILIVQ
ncbi:MAG: lamin tail domain-containing protein [Flavobacteriia bacterium]|nr:lamin tail domain-containing protein [Flavobacteriia bacterium]